MFNKEQFKIKTKEVEKIVVVEWRAGRELLLISAGLWDEIALF